MTENILVTGGAGFIGAHVAKALAAAGMRPVVIDDLSSGHRAAVRWGPLVEADVRDRSALEGVFQRYRPAALVHLAGLISVGESVAEPGRYYDVNLDSLLAVAEAMQRHGVERIVFSGSASVYGDPDTTPIREDAPMRPGSPYAFTKFAGERLLDDYARAHGLRPLTLRYFNAAGADPNGEIGEGHDPETHLIPLAIDAALGVGPPLTIFGDDYPTADGSAIRDYVHVSDLARAHVAALNALDGGLAPRAVNIGAGRGASVLETIAVVEQVVGSAVPRTTGPRRAGDSPSLVAATDLARTALGWRPEISDLRTVVKTALAWRLKLAKSASEATPRQAIR